MQSKELMSNNFGLRSPNDLNFRAWNRQEGKLLEDLFQNTKSIFGVAIHSHGKML